ncbi:MAG: hypothetical protein M1812_007844 [Candelaria pacifica]|nr:MAG: hypothetical protein M1812_007844 [Candelaria pacifica]
MKLSIQSEESLVGDTPHPANFYTGVKEVVTEEEVEAIVAVVEEGTAVVEALARDSSSLKWYFLFPAAGLSAPSEEVREAEDEIVSKQMELSLSGLGLGQQMPRRPAYGTDGTPVILRSNHFHIVVPDPNFQLYQYSVNVQPEPTVARKRRRAFELLVEMAPFLAEVRPAVVTNNQSMLISVKKLLLENDRGRFQITYFEAEAQDPGDRDTNLTFTISLTRALPIQQLLQSLTPSGLAQDIDKDSFVQALNIAMSRKPANTAGIVALPNTNKFFPVGIGFMGDLGGGLVALRGYFTSVRTSTLRLLLNINSITASFYQAGIRIEVSHLKNKDGSLRVRTIYGVATSPKIGATTQQVKFYWDEAASNVMVEDYFKRKWNIHLDTPGAPAINVGNVQRPNYMPPELCKVVPGQIARRKLLSDQTTEMIRVACRPPASNAGLITGEGAQVVGLGPGFSDGPVSKDVLD